MNRAIARIVGIIVVLLAGVGYKMYSGEIDGEKVAQKLLDNVNSGGAVSYIEEYTTDTAEGVYTYSRDAEGNILVSNIGTDLTENYEYGETDYKIGDKYYSNIEGDILEYGSDELNEYGYEGFDIAGYFTEQEEYVVDALKTNGTELFNNDIKADFKREGDLLVATGVDSNGNDYRVELAKDGSSLSLVDDISKMTVTFDTEAIVLPQ